MKPLNITAVTQEKLSAQAENLRLGDSIRAIILNQLQSIGGDQVFAVVAGGAVRDFWAATMYGLDLQGSGDIDICVIGLDVFDSDTFDADCLLVDVANNLRAHGYNVDKTQRHWNSEYEHRQDRLSLVMQMEVNGLDIDFLFYVPRVTTLPEMFETFDAPLNKFALSSVVHDELVVENFGFCPKEPNYIYNAPVGTDKLMERADKMYQRWQAVRTAHIGRAAHPYANIKG
ncbi:nucleotidyltransferase [Aeromonas phage ZPAH14]|uniref:Uncharacterized protein n=1 Tax=Aeromonas phage ZPAH14 TaxID=2924887 RepID=A0AAE9GZM2_9CAUD|nr:nucleotidyltransferase [Aeromonas phage ZPAH14]UOT58004.1 hypothetical protein [Aeromonas phage ZPAH14]